MTQKVELTRKAAFRLLRSKVRKAVYEMPETQFLEMLPVETSLHEEAEEAWVATLALWSPLMPYDRAVLISLLRDVSQAALTYGTALFAEVDLDTSAYLTEYLAGLDLTTLLVGDPSKPDMRTT